MLRDFLFLMAGILAIKFLRKYFVSQENKHLSNFGYFRATILYKSDKGLSERLLLISNCLTVFQLF